MTKADLVVKIYDRMKLSKNDSAELLETVFSIMKTTLEQGDTLKISGFGTFVVKQKQDRLGRNPQTGETLTIHARRVLTFKPSAVLKEQINRDGNAQES